jgi:hypothetical protein
LYFSLKCEVFVFLCFARTLQLFKLHTHTQSFTQNQNQKKMPDSPGQTIQMIYDKNSLPYDRDAMAWELFSIVK